MSDRNHNPIQLARANAVWSVQFSITNAPLERPAGNVRMSIPWHPWSLNMLRCDEPVTIGGRDRISLLLRISCHEDAEFTRPDLDTNKGNQPESARICIIRSMSGHYNRWFSTRGIPLQRGSYGLTVPLEPGTGWGDSQWRSVWGKHAAYDAASLAGFRQCLRNPVRIAIVFGGGLHAGHGVSVKRPWTAEANIDSLRIL